jgi:hypothetical protein
MTFTLLTPDGSVVRQLKADDIQEATRLAEALGYDVLDWAEPDALVVSTVLP